MKKTVFIKVIALFSMLGCSTQSSVFPVTSVETYLNQMIDYMESNHINRANINWVEFRANVQQQGTSAAKIADANETILYALELLNDQTSFLITKQGAVIQYGTACTDTNPDVVSGSTEIGYIKIPPFNGTGISAAVFAEKMHGEIRDQDLAALKGWIIDLRQNTGGNMWPMIAGVGPILGEGTAGFFVDSNLDQKPFGYLEGSSTFDDVPVVTITQPYKLSASIGVKVAILVDHATTNAGETVAVAFSGKALSKSFGASTCGRASGNQSFSLSDGSALFLTTSYLTDRNAVSKQGPIAPDEVVSDPALVFTAAVDWINQ
jgi:C-terminal processing protease CtpA/Prc